MQVKKFRIQYFIIGMGYIGKSKGTVVEEINDIIGVYSCDIVFLDSLNENIEKQIARDGIEIYCKSSS